MFRLKANKTVEIKKFCLKLFFLYFYRITYYDVYYDVYNNIIYNNISLYNNFTNLIFR